MIEKENVKARLTKLVEMVLERATPLADPALIAAAKELDIDLSSTSIRRVEQVFLDAVKSIHTTLDAHSGSRASRSVLREALDRVGRLEFAGLNPTEQRTRLISQFDIGVGRNKVQLDLGDSLPLHFLQLSNLVAEAAFGSPAVNPNLLAYWERWPELGFHDYRRTHSFVGVNGLIPRSLLCPREVQEQMGVHQVALPDLAVAHAAYRIVTGGDLFGGFAVRARGGTVLLDSPRGLESFLGLSDSAPVPIGGALTLRRTVVHTAKAGTPSASEPGGGQS